MLPDLSSISDDCAGPHLSHPCAPLLWWHPGLLVVIRLWEPPVFLPSVLTFLFWFLSGGYFPAHHWPSTQPKYSSCIFFLTLIDSISSCMQETHTYIPVMRPIPVFRELFSNAWWSSFLSFLKEKWAQQMKHWHHHLHSWHPPGLTAWILNSIACLSLYVFSCLTSSSFLNWNSILSNPSASCQLLIKPMFHTMAAISYLSWKPSVMLY